MLVLDRARFLLLLAVFVCPLTPVSGQRSADLREAASQAFRDGNHKDAYETYRKLALDAENDPNKVGDDMQMGIRCLHELGRMKEFDAFLEETSEVHAGNWRFLMTAAQSCMSAPHFGTVIAGEFERGHHRGGGRYVNCTERDRVRALQLMQEALRKAGDSADSRSTANLLIRFADILVANRQGPQAWRLQALTDLSVLPDLEEGRWHHRYAAGGGAPVDAEGIPVFHKVPGSFEAAQTDGERWRWMLVQAMEMAPGRRNGTMSRWAGFLYQQFGVQTVASYGRFFSTADDEEGVRATYAVRTLAEDETIAKLATGMSRFSLPAEYNYIDIYQQIADEPARGHGEHALNTLATIFENRRQFAKAAAYWQRSIKEYGPGHRDRKKHRVAQILGNWGRFEPVMTHAAGRAASLDYRFRNGRRVRFTAHEIRVRSLLADIKGYLKSNPRKLDWDRLRLGDIGHRLVRKKEKKYVGRQAAEWELSVEPREGHLERRITVQTPLKEAGAYLLTAQMEDGNTSKIVIWINDTVLARKPLNGRAYFFVADAVTGKPLPGVNVEFFGYRQERTSTLQTKLGRRYNVLTTNFAEFTDQDGQVFPDPEDFEKKYSWLIVATTKGDGERTTGRLATLGFSHVWYGRHYDREYNATKVLAITDRPVYRPAQPVRFKLWVRHAKYDQEDVSSFAGGHFTVRIMDPKGEKVLEHSGTADEYGGVAGEYLLPEDATLGVYSIQIPNRGGGTFRVEEYKKPEFEVTVGAPEEPVMLGEAIPVSIEAKYYFGAPVTKARVRYKVLRTDHSANWYPWGAWDWLYGKGYWWFAYDYDWYPGWHRWGCFRPRPWWWGGGHTPPEVVAEAETEIGEDGKIDVVIDTKIARELHGDTDHRYEITAEVTDASRRTIVGKGTVLVARKPFKVYAWVDRGHYRQGDTVKASFSARTVDNRPVKGRGTLDLYRIRYGKAEPEERLVETWRLDTNDDGEGRIQIRASEGGQYRLSYKVTDSGNHTIEGGYIFSVGGDGENGGSFRFSHIELVPDRRAYAPGDKVRLRINTDQEDSTVVFFVRPANGVYMAPQILHLTGKSTVQEIEVSKKDMPNLFVEAFTVHGGRLYSETREIVVPPEKRVLNVEVEMSSEAYKPGERAQGKIRLTDFFGQPFVGSLVVSCYDKSVEYISGGSNVPEIRGFFWKWRRRHSPRTESNVDGFFQPYFSPGDSSMRTIGVFGGLITEINGMAGPSFGAYRAGGRETRSFKSMGSVEEPLMCRAAMAPAPATEAADAVMAKEGLGDGAGAAETAVAPTVRTKFADTAFWHAALSTGPEGRAEFEFDMPENLTTWKVRAWALGHGTRVGEGTVEVLTTKNLVLRLQAPRFFVEKDEVVLSANIHNYLESSKLVSAVLELDGGCLDLLEPSSREVEVAAGGEARVDWRVKVVREGRAVVRMKALTDEESDAMEMSFPVYVHGMLKTDSFSGALDEDEERAELVFTVPRERRPEQSRLEIRYSPSLAAAMVDALPYLVGYPYGCTEQTLNRFLPTVITQKILLDMGLDLEAIRDKRANLNAQEIGDASERAAQWGRAGLAGGPRRNDNPVFDVDVVNRMVKEGLKRLTAMQLSDGGWGWFSGWSERSTPHLTATVVHGLQTAQANDVAVVPGVIERGVAWLKGYQAKQLRRLRNAPKKKDPWKRYADNLDALVYMVLVDSSSDSEDMMQFLYRDRKELSVYAKAMLGIALHRTGRVEARDMVMRNIEQHLVEDDENQTAYLRLPNQSTWWYWYGSEYEAHAYYLKLLAAVQPKSRKASRLVKYLLNNRKHATYWDSTRDTALCIEAMADYLEASGETHPDVEIELLVDGRSHKTVRIDSQNLFSFDDRLVLVGDAIEAGAHKIEVVKKGRGPLYFNAYLTNFTLEDHISAAGLEVKVQRKYFKLARVDKTLKARGSRGQAVGQKVGKYVREPLAGLAVLKSGDLVEVELEIESKNDYEYIVMEDMKPAGFEPVEVRSGYGSGHTGLSAYMELRDERVCFFVRALARGWHSVSYRLRAEIPGRFSALPTRIHAMYAPELKGNADEIKLRVTD